MTLQAVTNFYKDFLEPSLDTLGIGIYDNPVRRAVVVGMATGLVIWYFKPQSMFDEKGNPRLWSVFSDSPSATPAAWYTIPALTSSLSVILV